MNYKKMIKQLLAHASERELRLIYVFVQALVAGGDRNGSTKIKKS